MLRKPGQFNFERRTQNVCDCQISYYYTLGCNHASQSDAADEEGLVVRLASGISPATNLWEPANIFRRELEKASPEHGIEEGEVRVDFTTRGPSVRSGSCWRRPSLM